MAGGHRQGGEGDRHQEQGPHRYCPAQRLQQARAGGQSPGFRVLGRCGLSLAWLCLCRMCTGSDRLSELAFVLQLAIANDDGICSLSFRAML